MTQQKDRIPFLDELRGLSILLMVLYHGAYDLVVFFGADISAFSSPALQFFVPFFAGVFIAVSGVCCRFSRSNLRRGAICLGLGLGLTLFTALFLPSQAIWFGILHLLGCCMLLAGASRRLWEGASPLWALLFGALFLATFSVPSRRAVGLPGLWQLPLPGVLFSSPVLFPLGFPGEGFASADYFPLIPWAFLFFAGVLCSRPFAKREGPSFLYRNHLPFLAAVGRHTIWVYLLHQPAIFLLLGLLSLLKG